MGQHSVLGTPSVGKQKLSQPIAQLRSYKLFSVVDLNYSSCSTFFPSWLFPNFPSTYTSSLCNNVDYMPTATTDLTTSVLCCLFSTVNHFMLYSFLALHRKTWSLPISSHCKRQLTPKTGLWCKSLGARRADLIGSTFGLGRSNTILPLLGQICLFGTKSRELRRDNTFYRGQGHGIFNSTKN